MSHPAQQKKVAISYAWKQEKEGENKGAVDRLCERLTERGVPIRRDLKDLKHGDDIRNFMQSIGASDFLCVFLSDNYLRSPNCMYELLIAWERSRDNAAEFRSRVKVWRMPGMSAIHKMHDRATWVEYWASEAEKTAEAVQRMGDAVAGRSVDEKRRCKEIADKIDDILGFIGDTLSPDSFEEFEKWIEEEFPALKEPTEAELAKLYENTASKVLMVLNRNKTVSQFLLDHSDGLVESDDNGVKLHSDMGGPGFKVLPHLTAILSSFDPNRFTRRIDLDDLELVVGGVVVMAIDRKWVFEQRAKLASAVHQYPGRTPTVKLGSGMLAADFIHLITQAIADGPAQLQRLFSGEAREVNRNGMPDGHRDVPDYTEGASSVPDLPQEHEGISGTDTINSIKRHFIKHVLGVEVGRN